jgi:hypothetical protein
LECGKGGAMKVAMTVENQRLLLCRPEGGLNDILSEIGKCMAYCQRFNRILIVEANSYDCKHFKDRFSDYFLSNNPKYILDSAEFSPIFDQLTTCPRVVQGRVTNYTRETLWAKDDPAAYFGVTFDFSIDHAEALLVHHQNGRQKKRNALIALANLRLHDAIAHDLEARMNLIGGPYTAFHVRHTDYQTDFERRVLEIAPTLTGKIFLATDNIAVLDFFRKIFGRERVASFSTLPNEAGTPLHYQPDAEFVRQRNCDAILDLFTLALAADYFFFPRLNKRFELLKSYSGFSSLAARLRVAPHLLKQVLPISLHHHIGAPRIFKNLKQQLWRYF